MGLFNRAKNTEPDDRLVGAIKNQVQGARRTVLYDGELGLYQRWYFELRLKEETERATRYGLKFALMVLILHPSDEEKTWDLRVTRAAYLTARAVRSVDLTAVLDRGVFAICLLHCDQEGAEIAGQRLAASLEGLPFSVGGVLFPDDNLGAEQLLELARHRAAASSPAAPGEYEVEMPGWPAA